MMKKEDSDNLDLLLEKAFDEMSEEELYNEIGDIEVVEHEFSKEHNEKMQKLFAKHRKEKLMSKLPKILARVAVIGIAFAICSAMAVKTIDAYKNKFGNYIVNESEEAIRFIPNWKNYYISDNVDLMYLPNRFENTKEKISNSGSIHLKFENEEKNFVIEIREIPDDYTIDSEGFDVYNTTINDKEIMLLEKIDDNKIIISWCDDKYIYLMRGNVEKQELINIIANMKVKN